MRTLENILFTISGLFLISSTAIAQNFVENDSYLHERWEHMYMEPGEFTINDSSDIEVVDFEKPRDVRVCLDNSEHAVPLEVKYRGKIRIIRSGNCMVIEAKEISISAAERLDNGWNLGGTVEISS